MFQRSALVKNLPSIVLGAALAMSAVVTLVACGDAGSGISTRPSGYGYGGSGSASSGSDTGGANGTTTGASDPTGSPPDNNATQAPPAAKDYFASTVYPSFKGTCSGCHTNGPGPAFFGADAASTYATLDAGGYITQDSLLLHKGAHEGPALAPAQFTIFTTWLGYETNERAGKMNQPDVLAAVGRCMQQSKFDAIHFEGLMTMPRDNEDPETCMGCNNAPCRTCHSGGEAGFWMAVGSAIEDHTFQETQVAPYVRKFVTLQGAEPVPSNALWNKAIATQSAPAYTHPMFDVSKQNAAIVDFVQDAITRYKSGACQ
jgi:hypothetical protein